LLVEYVKHAVNLLYCSKCRRLQRRKCRRYRRSRTHVIKSWRHWDSSLLISRLRATRKLS